MKSDIIILKKYENVKAIDNSIVACVISKDDTFIIITPLDKHWYINSRIKTKKSK